MKASELILAEDNELNREIAETFLEDFGIKAESVVNGQEAVELLKKRGDGYFDVVFMDIQMPVMNGYQATRAIRELHTPYTDQLPIIAMTGQCLCGGCAGGFPGRHERACSTASRWMCGNWPWFLINI